MLATKIKLKKLFSEEGLVRHNGVSNFEVCHLQEMEHYATVMPVLNQIEFHPHMVKSDVIDYCRSKGIHITVSVTFHKNTARCCF